MSVAPLVRGVIVCRKVEVTDAEPNQLYLLHGVLNTVRPAVGISFPYREKELWIFVQYTDREGTHQPTPEVVRQTLESNEIVVGRQLPPIHMTAGRFAVLSRGQKLKSIPFPGSGIYEFRVRCGDNIATDEIRLEGVP